MKKIFFVLIFVIIIFTHFTSAVIVNSVSVQPLTPGQEGRVSLQLKNNLNDDARDVSLALKFSGIPFIPVGTSEQSTDEILEGDHDDFIFEIKASPTIVLGDYEIPYVLEYTINGETRTRNGSIGVKVTSNPILDYSITADNPVLNQKGKINLKIVNKGFSDARFVSVKVLPEDFTLLSESQDYIGEIQSDDFETATSDAIFTKTSPQFMAIIEYIDFDNKKVVENIQIPFSVYTEERAVELGIIKKNNLFFYILIAVAIIFLIIIWRIFRKRQRFKRNKRFEEER